VSKGYTLKMDPQSGRELSAAQKNGIRQVIKLMGVPRGDGEKVKMRWKVGFVIEGVPREEAGEVGSLGVD